MRPWILAIPLMCLAAVHGVAQQHRRDPLTDLEIDKIRDAAQEPEARLKLYIEFARARLEKLAQVRADEKSPDRDKLTRDALQDFLDVYDELDTNVDTYADRGDDLRKALKPVIEADTEFGSKLRAFKSSLGDRRESMKDFTFLLGSALEAIDAGMKDHRDLLAEQEETFKHKKKDKKQTAQRHE
jgi:hypothetical protein